MADPTSPDAQARASKTCRRTAFLSTCSFESKTLTHFWTWSLSARSKTLQKIGCFLWLWRKRRKRGSKRARSGCGRLRARLPIDEPLRMTESECEREREQAKMEVVEMMAMVERRPIQRRTQQDWRYPYRRTNSSPFPFSSSVVDPAIFFLSFFFSLQGTEWIQLLVGIDFTPS